MKRYGLHIHVHVKLFLIVLTVVLTAVSSHKYFTPLAFAAVLIFALAQGYFKAAGYNGCFYGLFVGIVFMYNAFGWGDRIVSRYIFVIAANAMPSFFACYVFALTPPSEIASGLNGLRFPKSTGVAVVTLFRYFPTVGAETRAVRENMRVRGLGGLRQYLLHPMRSFICVLIPLLIRALGVAEQLSVSAVTRGAESKTARHSLYEKRFGIADAAWLALFAAGAFCLFYFGRA
ncbi:MAG: energy-coupling factor transporter transmembrane protein EcfT [Clostridiales bacterium]|jgi:energy-coupling factor transport system permease protein|nr:energy-coupling factor transporter transmembrane protein EcfT [Clostridiales bacterium]